MKRNDLRAKERFVKADDRSFGADGGVRKKCVSVSKIDGFGSNNNGRMTNWLFFVPGSATRDRSKWRNKKDML